MACPECGAKRGHLGGCSAGGSGRSGAPKGKKKPQVKYITVECPTCRGTGTRGGGTRKCGLCDGKGSIRVPDE